MLLKGDYVVAVILVEKADFVQISIIFWDMSKITQREAPQYVLFANYYVIEGKQVACEKKNPPFLENLIQMCYFVGRLFSFGIHCTRITERFWKIVAEMLHMYRKY